MLSIVGMEPGAVVTGWFWLWPTLQRAAVRRGEGQLSILGKIVRGQFRLWLIPGVGVVVTRVAFIKGTGTKAMWMVMAAGRAGVPALKRLTREFEDIAREAGCAETRIEGRAGWGRVLGYERVGENGDDVIFRKVLTHER